MTEPTQLIISALETGVDLARGNAEAVHANYKGYYPERHAAADRDVSDMEAALTAARAHLEHPAPCDAGPMCLNCQPRNADGSCSDVNPKSVDYMNGFSDGMAEAPECQCHIDGLDDSNSPRVYPSRATEPAPGASALPKFCTCDDCKPMECEGCRINRERQPAPSTTGEADEYQYRTKPTWDANAPWSNWTKCNRGSFEDYKRTPVHNDWIYEARALFAATPPQVEPAPSTDICRNCAGQGWEPSVNNGKVPCSFCHPAPSTAGEWDRTIVSLPIPASASDLKSDIAELIQSHKYKGLRSIEVLGVFQFLGAEIISGSNS